MTVIINCPVCNGKADLKESECGFFVECQECDTKSLGYNTKKEAIETWNEIAMSIKKLNKGETKK